MQNASAFCILSPACRRDLRYFSERICGDLPKRSAAGSEEAFHSFDVRLFGAQQAAGEVDGVGVGVGLGDGVAVGLATQPTPPGFRSSSFFA